MTEFQSETWPAGRGHDTVPLYRARHNRLATALTVTREGHSEIHSNRISLSPKAEALPFAIRQPIHQGIGFFLYADKYAALLRRLVVEPTDSVECERFRVVYDKLMTANSLYLREIFLLCALVYSDQFGDDNLFEFSLWLEHALGAIRIEKQQVRYEAAQNFFKHAAMNLLDVIANGFRTEQVIAHLKAHHTRAEVYDAEKVESGKGVQGVYKEAVLAYYGRQPGESLQGRAAWILAKLDGGAP